MGIQLHRHVPNGLIAYIDNTFYPKVFKQLLTFQSTMHLKNQFCTFHKTRRMTNALEEVPSLVSIYWKSKKTSNELLSLVECSKKSWYKKIHLLNRFKETSKLWSDISLDKERLETNMTQINQLKQLEHTYLNWWKWWIMHHYKKTELKQWEHWRYVEVKVLVVQ